MQWFSRVIIVSTLPAMSYSRSRSNGFRDGWWSIRTPTPSLFSFSAASTAVWSMMPVVTKPTSVPSSTTLAPLPTRNR